MRRKNLSKILLVLALGISLLIPGLASAYTVSLEDTTKVQAYRWTSAYGGWDDIIASPAERDSWDLKKVDVTWTLTKVRMEIYTNYPGGSGLDNAMQADIGLTRNLNATLFDYGINMDATRGNIGDIYKVAGWTRPQDLFWSNGGWIYGGAYDQSNAKDTFTVIGGGQIIDTATVIRTSLGGPSDYLITVEFPRNLDSGNWNNFDFTVASGTCANDFQRGSVEFQFGSPTPLPSTLLLLGGGLLALTLLGRRRATSSRSRND